MPNPPRALHAALFVAALLAVSAFGVPAFAQCPCAGFEDAPPGPDEPGWSTRDYNVSFAGSDGLVLDASTQAHITDSNGNLRSRGGYLRMENHGQCPVWFGLSGVINDRLRPGETHITSLALNRNPQDTRPTRISVYARFCTAAQRPGARRAASSGPQPTFMCAGSACCVPGMTVASTQCVCPPDAVFRPSSENVMIGTCECTLGSWDAAQRQCVASRENTQSVTPRPLPQAVPPPGVRPPPLPQPQPQPTACNPACAGGQACVQGVCVGTGAMRMTMTWDAPGDMDLRVVTPSGTEIFYGRRSADGGALDHDDTRGTGPENVFWAGAPPGGTYIVCANPYSIARPTTFTITIEAPGQPSRSYQGTRNASAPGTCSRQSADFVAEVAVAGAAPAAPPPPQCANFAGTWTRPDGFTFQISQSGCSLVASERGSAFVHTMHANVSGDSASGVVYRTEQSGSGCTGSLYLTVRMLPGGSQFDAVTTGTDGLCGLPPGLQEHFVYSRR